MPSRVIPFLAIVLGCGRAALPAAPPKNEGNDAVARRRLAFVLLERPELPRLGDVAAGFARVAPGEAPRLTPSGGAEGVLVLEHGGDARAMVALQPAPVPDGEAEWHAAFSVPAAVSDWKLPVHRAHLVVFWTERARLGAVESARRFTWLLAAVAEASPAVGVYWAESGATHPADFFVKMARGGDLALLWSGVSIASDGGSPERMSVLSTGMAHLGLPDLELSVPRACDKGEALKFFYELLSYVAGRGAPIPEGETVGRTREERLPVRYVPSPVKPATKVWRIELPDEAAAGQGG